MRASKPATSPSVIFLPVNLKTLSRHFDNNASSDSVMVVWIDFSDMILGGLPRSATRAD
jgi:hypothetical protein